MGLVVLGVGGLGASNQADDTIRTYALGSCVGVVILAPREKVVGMIHVALPDSTINRDKAREIPGYFADTGIPALLRDMKRYGCSNDSGSMVVKLAGGANILDPNDTFSIGKRNVAAVKNVLRSHGLGVAAEDVGGNFSRTLSVEVLSGKIEISCPGRGRWNV